MRNRRKQCTTQDKVSTVGGVAHGAQGTLRSATVGALPILNDLLERMRLEEFLRAYLPPEDPRTKLYRIGLFVLAVPALAVVAVSGDPLKVLIYSQVALTIQLPLTILPLLWLVFSKKVMGEFRSGKAERTLAILATVVLTALNTLFLYTLAGGSF